MNGIMPLILLVIVGIAIYAWWKKRKSDQNANPLLSNRKNKDEVWNVIKRYLKDNNEKGKEIVDCAAYKRDYVDTINQNASYLSKKNKNYEVKIRKWQRKVENKKLRAQKKQEIKPPKSRDLFVVVFETKNSKTGQKDAPRCFECEIIQTRVNTKEKTRRDVVINQSLNYDTEMEWIAPVRAAEIARNAAIEKRLAKQREIKAKKDKKRLLRKQKKAAKVNKKKK